MPDAPSPLRLLLIEDEAPIRRFLRIVLEGAGHVMDGAARGCEGIERAATGAPSAVVLDLGLPDMDGKAVIAAIREWSDVPIVVVLVRSAEADIVAAPDAGADDYVTKPFAPAELLARLRALVRRRSAGGSPLIMTNGDLGIDLAARTVTMAGLPVRLTRKEFDVLALLARNAGRLLTHRELLQTIWGPAHLGDSHYLRIAVGHLREKLGDDAAALRMIFTEPGIGYRFASAE
ncbi:response regulator [Paracoccus benzoatiresistens]|uniref:Response regulator transcription factor n=1 Tax=Paracoccus benzoatiresistens TaxID=2997341 RepID=A0ABT4J1V1_9RHOB|nr:response regulator transcription factor [Paracoccus sp. EF6]MCZ0961063.1 response regulator transcription factor [Paracoccus sp. EF6]